MSNHQPKVWICKSIHLIIGTICLTDSSNTIQYRAHRHRAPTGGKARPPPPPECYPESTETAAAHHHPSVGETLVGR